MSEGTTTAAGRRLMAGEAVIQLDKVVVRLGYRRAVVFVEYDCCSKCGYEHLSDCGFRLALEMLPAGAETVASTFDVRSREVIAYRW